MALALIGRARDAGVDDACISAGSHFGKARVFQAQLRDWGDPYILLVAPSDLRLIPDASMIEDPGSEAAEEVLQGFTDWRIPDI